MDESIIKIIANIFSVIAMVLMFLSYQKMSKKSYLFMQIFSNLFFGIQYYLLDVKVIFISVLFFTIRAIVFYEYEKRKKQMPVWLLAIFLGLLLAVGTKIAEIHTNAIITVIIGFLSTIGLYQKELKTTYKISIASACLWTVYNFTVGAYLTNIINVVEVTAGIIGIAKLKKYDTKKVNELTKN